MNNLKTGTIIEIDRKNCFGVVREDFTHTEFVFTTGETCKLKPYDMVTFQRDTTFEHPVAKEVRLSRGRG